jgi:hypothetical protein
MAANYSAHELSVPQWARQIASLTLEEAADKLAIKDARGVRGGERLVAYETISTLQCRRHPE